MIQLEISVCMVSVFALYHIWNWFRLPRGVEARLILSQHANKATDMSVSFLVPAWNAADAMPGFVESFLKLNMPHKQLILCAGGSDGSFEIGQSYENAHVIVLEQRNGMGKQKALNMSLPHATGEVIFLTDIDCELTDDTVSGLFSALTDAYPVATGSIRPLKEQRNNPFVILQWAIRNASSPQEVTDTNGLLGANTAMLRSALDDIGGFSKEAPSGTDYTLAKELMAHGHKIVFVPNCEMTTEFPENLSSYVQKQSRWLRNVLVIAPRYKAWREVFSVLATVFLPIVYGVLLLFGFFLPLLWTLIIMMLLHATMNRLRYVDRLNHRVRVWITFVTVLGDLYAAFRAGYQWLRRNYAW